MARLTRERCIMLYTGTEHFQAERPAYYVNEWYVWHANVMISTKDLEKELDKMDKWEVIASD